MKKKMSFFKFSHMHEIYFVFAKLEKKSADFIMKTKCSRLFI